MEEINRQIDIINDFKIFINKEIKPFVNEFEDKEEIPRELIKKMGDKAYLGAILPAEYGGLHLDPVYYGLFTEAVGKVCCSTRGLLTVHTSLVGETILRFGTDEQKKVLLPHMVNGTKIGAFALTEAQIGSDAKSVRTAYTQDGNYYYLNGTKKWISFGKIADFFLVLAKDGNTSTVFIVDGKADGITRVAIKGLLAARSSHIAEITFDNVKVHKDNILGKVGTGFSYIINSALDSGRYSVAWGGLSIAQAALEAMVSYSRKREQFGEKICKFQIIQALIADAATNIHAARSLCLRAGNMRLENNQNATIETTIAKYFTSKIALKITSDAVQIHGANGCSNLYPVERLFRESKILEIIEGTSQIQQGIISKFALRNYYEA